jgi:hypothetical protein
MLPVFTLAQSKEGLAATAALIHTKMDIKTIREFLLTVVFQLNESIFALHVDRVIYLTFSGVDTHPAFTFLQTQEPGVRMPGA